MHECDAGSLRINCIGGEETQRRTNCAHICGCGLNLVVLYVSLSTLSISFVTRDVIRQRKAASSGCNHMYLMYAIDDVKVDLFP